MEISWGIQSTHIPSTVQWALEHTFQEPHGTVMEISWGIEITHISMTVLGLWKCTFQGPHGTAKVLKIHEICSRSLAPNRFARICANPFGTEIEVST